jgi:hypothetical protein
MLLNKFTRLNILLFMSRKEMENTLSRKILNNEPSVHV